MSVKFHPLQVKGKYYVENNTCTCSAACVAHAPAHFAMGDDEFGAYVCKQPTTPEEEAACREAMDFCPVEAIRDDGDKQFENSN